MKVRIVYLFMVYVEILDGACRTGVASQQPTAAVMSVTPPGKPRRKCCPYDFDSSICQIIDDRVLCGYNRNQGQPRGNNQQLSLSGGCRLRGGRVECGYWDGPYEGIRRPPPRWNTNSPVSQNEDVIRENSRELMKKSKSKPSANMVGVTKCVEIHSRIVCRQV